MLRQDLLTQFASYESYDHRRLPFEMCHFVSTTLTTNLLILLSKIQKYPLNYTLQTRQHYASRQTPHPKRKMLKICKLLSERTRQKIAPTTHTKNRYIYRVLQKFRNSSFMQQHKKTAGGTSKQPMRSRTILTHTLYRKPYMD